jgi:hypothetical protein
LKSLSMKTALQATQTINRASPIRITPDDDDWPADGRTTLFDPMADTPSPFGPSPEVDGLMALDEAAIRRARINNMGTAGHARLHRPQRALPPGRN